MILYDLISSGFSVTLQYSYFKDVFKNFIEYLQQWYLSIFAGITIAAFKDSGNSPLSKLKNPCR